MKKILITGADSYIGTSFEKWCSRYSEEYLIDTIDMRNESWKDISFLGYDSVFHVAGIVHIKSKAKKHKSLFFKINSDLAAETALKAKNEGVKQFIFMSSMSVYGKCKNGRINESTEVKPNNFYGMSKLQAEERITLLQDQNFKVVIIRPPMVYGAGAKGNYRKLAMLAKKVPVFPDIDNKRSMIHIDNLCEFIRLLIKNEENGIYFPQNEDYVKTSEMVKIIAEINEKKIKFIKFFNFFLKNFIKHINVVNKIFGNMTYEKVMSEYKNNYNIRDLKESIILSEKGSSNNLKKILFIITRADIGGAQKVVFELINYSLNKYDVTVVVGKGNGLINWIEKSNLKIKIIQLHELDRDINLRKDIICLCKLIKLIKINNFDIVHCHSAKAGVIGRTAAFICGVKKIVYTVHGWGSSINNYQKWYINIFYSIIELLMSFITTDIVLVSKEDMKLVSKLKIDKKKIKIIYNGIKSNFLNIENKIWEKERYEIITVARVAKPKDWLNTVKVLEELKRKGIKFIFYWLGNGEEFNNFKNIVNKFEMADEILLTGNVDNVYEFLHQADLFLLLTKWEGLPISIIEALFSGLPIIASDVGGNNELVYSGVNGYLINDNNEINYICDKIISLLVDNDLRKRMASSSQDIAQKYFCVENMIKQYFLIYDT